MSKRPKKAVTYRFRKGDDFFRHGNFYYMKSANTKPNEGIGRINLVTGERASITVIA